MIITDVKGGKLKLTRTALTELTGEVNPGHKWTLDLTELIRKGATNGRTALLLRRIDRTYGEVTGACAALSVSRQIGCRWFTVSTFARIMRAALDLKEKGTRKRK